MTDKEKIERMTKILNEADFIEVTKDDFMDGFESCTIAELKESMWKLYCFMSDVCDTLNM